MSMLTILVWHLDLLLFLGLSLGAIVTSIVVIRLKKAGRIHRPFTFALVILSVGIGIYFSEKAERAERDHIFHFISGLAPTFANVLSKHGHAGITDKTPPDDPDYLYLIERQKNWLRLNPQITDIYTYRRAPDGSIVFIVDSETDHNKDGQFSGTHEARAPIGIPYASAGPNNVRALDGTPTFDTAPIASEEGGHISFNQPMYDKDGQVEAALGIDFDATTLVRHILTGRALTFVVTFVFLLGTLVSATLIALMRAQITIHEITERSLEEARIEADRANRIKSEFLATMSHEIRTPMNSLIGFSNLLFDTPLTREQRDYTHTLRSSAHSLLALLDDILDFSKIEAGRTVIEKLPFDVSATIASVIALLGPRAHDKKLALVLNDRTEDLKIVGDSHRLRQILINLVSNAVKFTDTGTIIVSVDWNASPSGTTGLLRCEVTDTGIGIPTETIGQLFQKFSQADASTTRRHGGTGLGLAISRELTQLMGGTLTVKSEVGYGSSFTVQLPATRHLGHLPPSRSSLPSTSPRPFELTTPASSGRILLAEDNPTNRKLATIILEKLGYTVDVATNGREALQKIDTHPYRAVLMDCEMPELDGYEATRALRIREKLRPKPSRLPVIALTANIVSGAKEKCLDAGMDLYLTKPIKFDQLRTALSSIPAMTA